MSNNSNGWNLGEKEKKGLKQETEYAVLVGVSSKSQSEEQLTEYLDELEFLALTAGAVSKKRYTQRLDHPDRRTLVGSGKVQEIKNYIEEHPEISMVIFDDDLSGKQTNILEEELKVKIIDRSSLILDIFAKRAQTAQAKTQVELAQMQYLLPRLRGLWTHLERQRGGGGFMGGPGETQIEADRRLLQERIVRIKRELETVRRTRDLHRAKRQKVPFPVVAIVGYTNAGKSTLFNRLTGATVMAEDMLFATLDPTLRRVRFPHGTIAILSDTVGFIKKLPHDLVASSASWLLSVNNSAAVSFALWRALGEPQYLLQNNVIPF